MVMVQVRVFQADEMEFALASLGLLLERIASPFGNALSAAKSPLRDAHRGHHKQRGQNRDGLQETALHEVPLLYRRQILFQEVQHLGDGVDGRPGIAGRRSAQIVLFSRSRIADGAVPRRDNLLTARQ